MTGRHENKEKNASRKIELLAYTVLFLASVIAIIYFKDDVPDITTEALVISVAVGIVSSVVTYIFVQRIVGWSPLDERIEKFDDQREQIKVLLDIAADKISPIDTYASAEEVYAVSKEILQLGGWKNIRMFAPVGIWIDDTDKTKHDTDTTRHKISWLKALAEYTKANKVTVQGIFGLPPIFVEGKRRPSEDITKDVDQLFSHLGDFSELKSQVEFHYLEPAPAALGFAVLIFEGDRGNKTAFAFAARKHAYVIDTGIGINSDALFPIVRDWFSERMFNGVTRDQILHDGNRSLIERKESIKSIYTRTYSKEEPEQLFFNDADQVDNQVRILSEEFQERLRVLIVGGVRSDERWTDLLALRLSRLKSNKSPSFEALIVVKPNLPLEALKELDEEVTARMVTYRKFKVTDCVHLYVLEAAPPTNFDLFLYDQNHTLIGIPVSEKEKRLHKAVVLRNQPAVTESCVTWFDKLLRQREVVDYNTWRKNRITDADFKSET